MRELRPAGIVVRRRGAAERGGHGAVGTEEDKGQHIPQEEGLQDATEALAPGGEEDFTTAPILAPEGEVARDEEEERHGHACQHVAHQLDQIGVDIVLLHLRAP